MKKDTENQKAPSVADTIWNSIKDVELPMFAVSGKTVADYCERVEIEPSKLFLKLKVPAVLPMLESVFEKKYNINMGTLYCEVSVKAPPAN